jgi:hypothetical protein
MGYTAHTVSVLEMIIKENDPKSVLDLGAQNLYNQPLLPAPYASSWYEKLGIDYACIDLNGENNAMVIDLSHPWPKGPHGQCDLLVDAGTSEHVGINGAFSWEAIYNCWKTKFELVRKGGIIYSENPKEGNWPLHGWNYYTAEFYHELDACSGLCLLKWGEVCAMGNCTDGRNIWAIQKKTSDLFPSFEKFVTLSLKQS